MWNRKSCASKVLHYTFLVSLYGEWLANVALEEVREFKIGGSHRNYQIWRCLGSAGEGRRKSERYA